MFTASNIQYELAEKTRGLGTGGIGAMHLLARRIGLIEAIDRRLHLLKVHKPYHESDHVLNIAYNLPVRRRRAWRTSNCGVTTRSTWMPWGPSGFPTRRRQGTSAGGSTSATFRS